MKFKIIKIIIEKLINMELRQRKVNLTHVFEKKKKDNKHIQK